MMNWKQLKWKLKYWSQFFPFTFNTALCVVAVWGAYRLLYTPTPKGEVISPFTAFIVLMGKMTFLFVLGLVGVSIVSAFVSFVYYLALRNSNGVKMQLEFTTESRPGKGAKLFLNARLDGAIRPVLGFIKGRLYYDDNILTDRFSLLSNKRKDNSIWRAAITGKSQLILPDIKEYNLKGGFIYFQDMLNIFSLALSQPVSGHFYQPPALTKEHDAQVSPKKTETLDVRIDQLRRVEGEYLNYKDFEAGDDVRRIVWKVYAKNRELVVRVPELYEPYASHLYLYASFYADTKRQWMNEGYFKEMLNYYKNNVWTIYDTLSKKEWELRYVSDQPVNIPEQLPEHEKTAKVISNNNWHKDLNVSQYFNAKSGAVLCISSLTDIEELKTLLEKCDSSTVVYFIKVSSVLKEFAPLALVKRLIFLPPDDRLSKLKTKWTFSPIRIQVQKREKEIEELLNKSHVISGTI